MDNAELQQLTERISRDFFHKEFRHCATFNERLRTTGGRYLLRSHNIEINRKYYDELGLEELVGIIKHELCHYHLHIENKGYQHRNQDFKNLLKEVDAPRFCSALQKQPRKKPRKLLHYQCKQCSLEYTRKRRIDTLRYVCGKCKGKLHLVKEVRHH